MTKRYKILLKKLKELKAELIYVFSIPEEKNPYHQLLSEEIEQRFLFLKKLLSAEIASNPSKPHHLQHIAQRLNELETAFRQWDDHRRTSADVNNFDDSASICSCDDSCRNDDGEAYDNNNDAVTVPEPDFDSRGEGLSFSGGLVDVNVEQDSVKKIEADADADDEGCMSMTTKQDKGTSYCGGGILSGMIFGGVLTALIMSRFCSGCFYFAVHESFLIPT